MILAHPALSEFLKINDYSRYNIGLVSLGEKIPKWIYYIKLSPSLRKSILQQYLATKLFCKALKEQKNNDLVIIMEVFPIYMVFCNIFLSLFRKKMIFIMHDAQQKALVSKLHYLALKYFKFFNFYSVDLEIDDSFLPKKFCFRKEKLLVFPHPITEGRPSLLPGERRSENEKIKIGILGKSRKGKPKLKLARKVKRILENTEFNNCELVVGHPRSDMKGYEALLAEKILVHNTDLKQEYFELLKDIDIYIEDFEEKLYFFRASGTIADAVSCGCHVVCPDYPVIRHQVMWPCRVGTVYSSLGNLEIAILKAIQFVKKNGKDNNWKYREKRDAKSITGIIDKFIEDKNIK